jgi:hypothetical protein
MRQEIYLWRKVVCFVVCFVCRDKTSETISCCTLDTIGKPLMSRVHWVGCIMFSTYAGEVIEYWINVFIENSLKSKLNIIGEFWAHSWYRWKALSEQDLMKVVWKFLDLRWKRDWILSSFLSLEIQLNHKRMVWGGKFSWVRSSHLHRRH